MLQKLEGLGGSPTVPNLSGSGPQAIMTLPEDGEPASPNHKLEDVIQKIAIQLGNYSLAPAWIMHLNTEMVFTLEDLRDLIKNEKIWTLFNLPAMVKVRLEAEVKLLDGSADTGPETSPSIPQTRMGLSELLQVLPSFENDDLVTVQSWITEYLKERIIGSPKVESENKIDL